MSIERPAKRMHSRGVQCRIEEDQPTHNDRVGSIAGSTRCGLAHGDAISASDRRTALCGCLERNRAQKQWREEPWQPSPDPHVSNEDTDGEQPAATGADPLAARRRSGAMVHTVTSEALSGRRRRRNLTAERCSSCSPNTKFARRPRPAAAIDLRPCATSRSRGRPRE